MKWINAAQVALMGMVALALSHQPVLADTTTLVCSMAASMPWTEQGTTTVELDEAKSLATVHWAPTRSTFSPSSYPGGMDGPLVAVFATDTIAFTTPGPHFAGNYIINRLTGAMIEPNANFRWDCHPAQKQF